MRNVTMRSSAWLGDSFVSLEFPSAWDLHLIQHAPLTAMSGLEIEQKLRMPLHSTSLSKLVYGRRSVVIIIDDINRPTPTALILPPIIDELIRSGVDLSAISIVVAGGTHQVASAEEIAKKVGPKLPENIRIIAHDMTKDDLVPLGKTSRGTPISVNRFVMEAELKIGVGGIYPHPTAGFSGGSKIVSPGVCGIETARILHENFSQGDIRGKLADNNFRDEVDKIATKVGLEFIVNVIINKDREIVGIFAGHPILAHRDGIRYALQNFTVDSISDADVIIADAYPFDTSFVFAEDRSLWPFANTSPNSSRVVLAACPKGKGTHELDLSVSQRVRRRLMSLSFAELRRLPQRLRNLKALLSRNKLDFLLLTSGLSDTELKQMYSSAEALDSWPSLLQKLRQRHSSSSTRVVLYQSAPLLIDSRKTL